MNFVFLDDSNVMQDSLARNDPYPECNQHIANLRMHNIMAFQSTRRCLFKHFKRHLLAHCKMGRTVCTKSKFSYYYLLVSSAPCIIL